ncbi:MAG: hypothetical protein MUC42_04905 [Bryobacter sp.]|jgi:hypothetical protein|nr:hypothetical protein [Bryobacter sp.]
MGALFRNFVTHVVPSVAKPLRVLWNEIIGLIFVILAVGAIGQVFVAWRNFDGSGNSLFRLGLSAFFGLMMGGYGISSFWRARKISRS